MPNNEKKSVNIEVPEAAGAIAEALPPTISIEERIDRIQELVLGSQTSIQLNQKSIKWTQIGIFSNIAITIILFVVTIWLQYFKAI